MINSKIDKFHKILTSLKSLKPHKETNKHLNDLCIFCKTYDEKIKVNKKILEINEICSKAEYEMEKFWSEKIINSENPEKELENFWYYENYEKLIKLEFLNANFLEENIKEVLFVGGGPLPLSAIILAKKFGINGKIIDLSEEAISISKKLIKKLKLQEKIKLEQKNILYYKDEKKYDLVYVASLVFGNKNQENILKKIKNLDFSKLLVRTSHGTRKILYKEIDKNILKKYFKFEIIVHPKNDIINSFIILSKK